MNEHPFFNRYFTLLHLKLINILATFINVFWTTLVPFECMEGTAKGVFWCLGLPQLTNVEKGITKTYDYEKSGLIDPVNNMKNSKIFIFHGTKDMIVRPGN